MRKFTFFSPVSETLNYASTLVRRRFNKMLLLGAAGVFFTSMSFAQMAACNYTINSANPTSGSNYNTFNDFISALSTNGNAIAGAIVVEVVSGSGPYTETITIPAIQGTGIGQGGARIGITFKGNGEKLTYNGASTSNATVELNGADYITFQNLHIERGSSGSYKYGVRLWGNADNNRFDSCHIDMGTSYSTSNWIAVVASSSNTSQRTYALHYTGLEIWNSTITGGYYGLTSYGPTSTTSTWNSGLHLKNTKISDQQYYGLYIYYGNRDITIDGCSF